MAYTLTQARPLLTANELELFDQSRTDPIKNLTLARLRTKVTRARALRDKYRDLYRRQTVATRTAPAARRAAMGGDNERTQRKAQVMEEVLGRFQARVQLLEERQNREAERAAAARRKANSVASSTVALKKAVKKAVKVKQRAAAVPARKTRSAKAPAKRANGGSSVGKNALGSAPRDVEPEAKRRSPLKQQPRNMAIHAHQGSLARRMQVKRDSAGG